MLRPSAGRPISNEPVPKLPQAFVVQLHSGTGKSRGSASYKTVAAALERVVGHEVDSCRQASGSEQFLAGCQESHIATMIERRRRSKRYLRMDWGEFYMKELEENPFDDGLKNGGSPTCFGKIQRDIPYTHRHKIVRWISEACRINKWSYASFHSAVHAFDSYIVVAPHHIKSQDLGPLSAACLYYGVHLHESTSDRNIISLDAFKKLCPEIGCASTVQQQEAHVLDQLEGATLGCRNPYEMISTWICLLGQNSLLYELYDYLVISKSMKCFFQCLLQLSNVIYLSGLNLVIPPSTVLAAGMVLTVRAVANTIRQLPLHLYGNLQSCFVVPDDVIAETVASQICFYPGGMKSLFYFCPPVHDLLSDLYPRLAHLCRDAEKLLPHRLVLPNIVAESPAADPASSVSQSIRSQLAAGVRKALESHRTEEDVPDSEPIVFTPLSRPRYPRTYYFDDSENYGPPSGNVITHHAYKTRRSRLQDRPDSREQPDIVFRVPARFKRYEPQRPATGSERPDTSHKDRTARPATNWEHHTTGWLDRRRKRATTLQHPEWYSRAHEAISRLQDAGRRLSSDRPWESEYSDPQTCVTDTATRIVRPTTEMVRLRSQVIPCTSAQHAHTSWRVRKDEDN